MWKYNEERTGLNDKETQLTVKAVSGTGFAGSSRISSMASYSLSHCTFPI
jgi:hypothetical protein